MSDVIVIRDKQLRRDVCYGLERKGFSNCCKGFDTGNEICIEIMDSTSFLLLNFIKSASEQSARHTITSPNDWLYLILTL